MAVTDQRSLSEHDAKQALAAHGVPVSREIVVSTADAAVTAAGNIGHPAVLKLCGPEILHKTELGGVKLSLIGDTAVHAAATDLLQTGPDGVQLLVAEQIMGNRELIAGVTNDPQFGPTLMFGIGGIFAEVVADVVFRLLPVTNGDITAMIGDLANAEFLEEFRGEPAVDKRALAGALRGLADFAGSRDDIESVDINPFVVANGLPIAVDAMVVLQ